MINFVLHKSQNYRLVQETLLKSVAVHLDRGRWTSSLEQRRDGSVNFSLFIRLPTDILMSHGVADKNYLTILDADGDPLVNQRQAVLVPGAWLKRKLISDPRIRLGDEQIHTVGWPRLDILRRLAQSHPRPAATGRRRVLWAPTHDFRKRGDEQLSTSSYPAFEEYVPQLEREFDVSVSLHPRNRANKAPTDVALIEADAVISDFGTLVYEAWALGKPVLFPRWILGDRIQQYLPESAEAHIFESRLGYHPGSIEEMLETLRGPLEITPDVEAFMADYVDNYRSGLSGLRVAHLLETLDPGGR
jgi:CDP-glycerol glycerophosphotransferase (TagB/SpsB family)